MIKLEHVVLPSPEQMKIVIKGMRNPMNSWGMSDSGTCLKDLPCHSCHENRNNCKKHQDAGFVFGENLKMSKKDVWWQMIQLLPSSYNQRRTVMLNYEVLANIYKSRRSHKLDEWLTFCDWIEGLPYREIILTAAGVKEV